MSESKEIVPTSVPFSDGLVRCPRCKGTLQPSGQEPYRHICKDCGGNFRAVLHFVEIAPVVRPVAALPATEDDLAK